MPFLDRVDAGRKLARALASYKDRNPVVLALPRGGVPIGAEIAAALARRSTSFWCARSARRTSRSWRWARWWMATSRSSVRNQDVIDAPGVSEREF